MGDRKESKEENNSGHGWMIALGVGIGALASAIGYFVGRNSVEEPQPQCNIPNSTSSQRSTSEAYQRNVVTCDKCLICLDSMDVAVLPCKHSFHKKCIEKWIRINGRCPTCRESLD